MSETDLSRSIRDALEAVGIWVERTPAGSWRVKNGWVHGLSAGTPDLFCPELSLWLECKVQGGKPRPSQELWHARAKSKGVRVAIVRSVSEALEVATTWRMELKR